MIQSGPMSTKDVIQARDVIQTGLLDQLFAALRAQDGTATVDKNAAAGTRAKVELYRVDLQTTNNNGTKNFQVQVNRARKGADDKTSIAEMHMPHTVGFTKADIVGALTASLQAFETNAALKCAELHDGIDRKALRKEYTRYDCFECNPMNSVLVFAYSTEDILNAYQCPFCRRESLSRSIHTFVDKPKGIYANMRVYALSGDRLIAQ
jgi:hypothetical protein